MSTEHLREDEACCACRRVAYGTTDNGDGTVSGYWACDSCGRRFLPRVQHWLDEVEALRARVEALEDGLRKTLPLLPEECRMTPETRAKYLSEEEARALLKRDGGK